MKTYTTVEEEQKAFAIVMANDAHPERGAIYPVYDDNLELLHFNRWSPSDGLYELWYPTGQLYRRFQVATEGERYGLIEEWHDNGQLISRITYKAGVRDGLCEMWNNGQLEERSTYEAGRKL